MDRGDCPWHGGQNGRSIRGTVFAPIRDGDSCTMAGAVLILSAKAPCQRWIPGSKQPDSRGANPVVH